MNFIHSRFALILFRKSVFGVLISLNFSCHQADSVASDTSQTQKTTNATPASNLVQNFSFEDGESKFSIPGGLAEIDASRFQSGQKSLKVSNTDPMMYRWVSQDIPVAAGGQYSFRSKVKGEKLVSIPDAEQNRGAGIFLEWYDVKGEWLGGSYPQGKLGTFDWTEMAGTATLPLNARRMVMGLYLRKGTTGTAWFDDLEVVSLTPPLRVFVKEPAYRGLVRRGDTTSWKAQLSVRRDGNNRLRIRSRVLEGNKILLSQIRNLPQQKEKKEETTQWMFVQDPGDVVNKSGTKPQWRLEVLNEKNTVLASQTVGIRVLDKMPRVTIARGGAWRVLDKPFYPLGIYTQFEDDTSDKNLAILSKAGFNTVLSYGYGAAKGVEDARAFLDRAQKHNIKVIFNLKDFHEWNWEFPKHLGKSGQELTKEYVSALRNHPALLAWYLNDEGDLEHIADYKKMYETVTRLDPNHPAVHVLLQYGSLDGYYHVTDVLGVDPYPIPQFTFDIVPQWTDAAVRASRGAKSPLLVSQAFSWEVYPISRPGSRYPTEDEIRCMNLLGIISGAKGVVFYAFMDLYLSSDGKRDPKVRDEKKFMREWKNVSTVSRELATLLPILKNGVDVKLQVQNSAPSQLKVRAIKEGSSTRVLIANASADKAATLTILSPQFVSAKIQNGALRIQKQDTAWKINVPPHGSGVITCY